MFLILGSFLVVAWLAFKYVSSYFNYWKIRGVPQVEGYFPIGSSPNIDLSKQYQGYDVQYYYNELSPHPFGGYYKFMKPTLLVRDPGLIQHIMVKDFSHFRNRFKLKNTSNRIMDQHLFALEGDKWRALRVKLTPTFTAGKLKQMFSIFDECSSKLTARINLDIKINETLDVKEIMSQYTLDLIVTCAFGLELNSLENDNNSFAELGRIMFPKAKTAYRNFLVLLRVFAPGLARRLPTVIPGHLEQNLIDSISNTIKHREDNNVKRNDFLNLLIDLKNKGYLKVEKGDERESSESTKIEAEDVEIDLTCIVAQCFVFFLAGFETSSSVQTGALFELALNQNLQDKLRHEIKTVMEKHQALTYQSILEMKYLDQVVKETIRKYPTVPLLTRLCVKKYKMPNSDIVIDEGTQITIPVYALHHDPIYFPEPDKFKPERFSEANEGNIKPCTYMPFGEGPRQCIGMRFGLLQTKMGLITVLSNFRLSQCMQTVNPMQFSSTPLVSTTSHPVILKFEKL